MPTITLIIPSYNEESSILPFYEKVNPYLKKDGYVFKYLFVDDGSQDNTLSEIKKLREKDKNVTFISFSKNFGKEAAMKAGLEEASSSDAVIMMDADLQHPPYLIEEMLEKYTEGYKIIYTKQKSRKKEGLIRKSWAKLFYSVFNRYSDVRLEQSTKDFMLIDKMVVKAFLAMPDNYRFTRGILSFVGFKRCALLFDYVERETGKSKWNFPKLLKYGVSGLNQFSTIFRVVPFISALLSFLVAVMSIFFYCFKIMGLDSFIVLLSLSLLFFLTNVSLYFVLYVLYGVRREVIKRPLYFIEEKSEDE